MNDENRPASADQGRDRRMRHIAGRDVYFDWEDFLWDPDDWCEAIALELARESGMAGLDKVHWEVIRFMRAYYYHHGRAPMNKDLKQGTGMALLQLESLFPEGIRRGARRLAGLPNPKACL